MFTELEGYDLPARREKANLDADERRLALVDQWLTEKWEGLTNSQPEINQDGLKFISPNPKEKQTINYHPEFGFKGEVGGFRNYTQMVELLAIWHGCRVNDMLSVFARLNITNSNPFIKEANTYFTTIVRDTKGLLLPSIDIDSFRHKDEQRRPRVYSPKILADSVAIGI